MVARAFASRASACNIETLCQPRVSSHGSSKARVIHGGRRVSVGRKHTLGGRIGALERPLGSDRLYARFSAKRFGDASFNIAPPGSDD